jgi:hypothetical protein
MYKIVPVPEGDAWGCLPCEMHNQRDVNADVLLMEGEPGKIGIVDTGLCANHAEVLNLDDIHEAQRLYREMEGE